MFFMKGVFGFTLFQNINVYLKPNDILGEFFSNIDLCVTLKYVSPDECALPPMNEEALKQKLEEAVNTIPKCRNKCVVNDLTLDCTGSGSNTAITATFNVTIFNPHPNEIPLSCTAACKNASLIHMLRDSFAVGKGIKAMVKNNREALELSGNGAPSIDVNETQAIPSPKPKMSCYPGLILTETKLCG